MKSATVCDARSLGIERDVVSYRGHDDEPQTTDSGFGQEILDLFRKEDPDVYKSPKTWQELMADQIEEVQSELQEDISENFGLDASGSLTSMPEIGKVENLSDMTRYL